MSLAPIVAALGSGDGFAQFGELRGDRALAAGRGFGRRAFPCALRAEQAVDDGGAGAGQRQIGHRDVRMAHRERQRGAGLVAVERAMAGGIEPERALPLPDLQRVGRFAGPSAFVTCTARTIILGARGSEIGAEAEALVGQGDRPVRIAFAGGDAVAEAGDEEIAHHDLGGDALRRLGSAGNLYSRDGGAAVARPEIDRLGTIQRRLPGRTFAVIERPGAGRAHRNGADQPGSDGMIHWRQIAFLDVVAGAGLADTARQIDAETVDRIARPAAAVAL